MGRARLVIEMATTQFAVWIDDGDFMGDGKKAVTAEVVWIGDSRNVLKTFLKAIQGEFGIEIWALQQGERPSDCRPMPPIGKGVF